MFISNTFFPARPPGAGGEQGSAASWELRVEGKLLSDDTAADPARVRAAGQGCCDWYSGAVFMGRYRGLKSPSSPNGQRECSVMGMC